MDLQPNSILQKGSKKRGTGVYRGIRFRKDKWISEIRVSRTATRIWLGSHFSAEKAARAYDAALYCPKGEKGIFNFPDGERLNPSKGLDLSKIPKGPLRYAEIRRIAPEFFSMEEERVDKPTMLPPMEFSPPMELSPPEKIPQFVKPSVVPNWEIDDQSCANKVEISEEPYIPTFESEEASYYDPDFVPDGKYLAELYMDLEQWGVLDEDWLRYSQNKGL